MIAYRCRHCGKFTISGVVNELNEHFCTEKCYKKYCTDNSYIICTDKLRQIIPIKE